MDQVADAKLLAQAQPPGLRRELLFSLRNLLSSSSVFLLLAFNVRFCLFLHRLLAFVFWRFVAHGPKAKVGRNTDQLRDLCSGEELGEFVRNRPRPRM